jgi:hypothetical protein
MRRSVVAFTLLLAALPVLAWDYPGHRVINQLALGALPPEFPEFVRSAAARERIAFLSGEPDRWRNAPDLALRHFNGPDHFLDLEDLEPAGLEVAKLPRFRYDVVAQVARARAANPGKFPPLDPTADADHTRWLPGLPWTIAEHYGKLRSGFAYVKAFEKLGTAEEVANAQSNVIYWMGTMGHFVGDASQPLHTTRHFNGWAGDNPQGFTTDRGFHQLIDGGFWERVGLDASRLATRVPAARSLLGREPDVRADDPFPAVMRFLLASHEKIIPLYRLEKEGKLRATGEAAGEAREFLEGQMARSAALLADLWLTAWQTAPEDAYLMRQLEKRRGQPAAPRP